MSHRIQLPDNVAAHFGFEQAFGQDFSFVDDAANSRPEEPDAFIAIDPFRSHEIDDSISVRKDGTSGFIVKLATPDGSLVPASLLEQALRRKRSDYGNGSRNVKTLLPSDLSVGALSLSDGQKRPAVVATMQLSAADGLRLVDLARRTVKSHQTTYYRLENKALKLDPKAENWSLLRAVNAYRESMALPALQPGGTRVMSHFIVEHFAVGYNMLIPALAAEKGVPLLHRNFEGQDETGLFDFLAEESRGASAKRASYSTKAIGHAAFGGMPYAQVTTPLARASDLFNHQQIPALLSTGESAFMFTAAQLDEVAAKLNR